MEVSRPIVPCARCLADVSTASGETARCEKCQTPLLESIRRWVRFVQRDARVLSFVLIANAAFLGISIVPTIAMTIGGLWIDPTMTPRDLQQGLAPHMIVIGLLGMVAGCMQLMSFLGWILVFALSFGSVFARATMPLLALGGWMIFYVILSMTMSFVIMATNAGNPEEAQKSVVMFSAIGGALTGVVTNMGIYLMLSALQRSFTTDRRGFTLLLVAAIGSSIMTVAAVAAALSQSGRPIDSTMWTTTLVVSVAVQGVFLTLVVLRLVKIRSFVQVRAKEAAGITYGVATMASGTDAPPLIRT